jgi:DNA mismatch endonuclease (patch repair protein)
MRAQKTRDTAPELALRHRLYALGYRYLVDAALPLAGIRRRADLLFRRQRVVVFVDSCFWHVCPEHASWPSANATWWKAKLEANERRDADTTQRLTSCGWTVVRIWTHEDTEAATGRVVDALPVRSRPRSEPGRVRSGSRSPERAP